MARSFCFEHASVWGVGQHLLFLTRRDPTESILRNNAPLKAKYACPFLGFLTAPQPMDVAPRNGKSTNRDPPLSRRNGRCLRSARSDMAACGVCSLDTQRLQQHNEPTLFRRPASHGARVPGPSRRARSEAPRARGRRRDRVVAGEGPTVGTRGRTLPKNPAQPRQTQPSLRAKATSAGRRFQRPSCGIWPLATLGVVLPARRSPHGGKTKPWDTVSGEVGRV